VTGSEKTVHLIFNFFIIFYIANWYALVKFWPCVPATFGDAALQSSNIKKIDLYILRKYTTRLYKNCCNLRVQCSTELQLAPLSLGKFFLPLPFFSTHRDKISEKFDRVV